MTIIIETTTTTRERLVLVSHGTCTDYVDKPGLVRLVTTDARDATPDDLARGGYVPVERAEKAERERDEEKRHAGDAADALARLMRERDTLRAELARLTLVDEEEPTDAALRDAFAEGERKRDARHVASPLRIVYRLGVAHERARHAAPVSSTPVTSDRATEDELEELYATAYARAHGRADEETLDKGEYAGLRAVAARVRQERCLVAQAVARNADFHVTECMGGRWRVVVTDRDVNSKTELCAPSDVPATLARLLGEVSRG